MPFASRPLPKPPTLRWDGSIDLTGANARIGRPLPGHLVDEVRQAVEALPGAGYVSVEVHDQAPRHLRWLVLYPARSTPSREGRDWDECHDAIEQAVRKVTGVW